MESIKKTDEKLILSGKVSTNLANAIRRSALKVPVLAVDEVEIEKNDSALYDETLAHRIGLVPLKMTKDIKEDSVVKLKLSSKNPGYVYAEELKGDVEVAFGRIPLTLLREGQEVKLKAKAIVGKGVEHSKFSPGIFTYRIISEITLPKKYKEKVSKMYPENSIKDKGENIVIKDDKEKTVIDYCTGLCERDKEEFSVKDTDEIVFNLETYGQLKVEDVFKQSIEILKKDLKDFSKEFK